MSESAVVYNLCGFYNVMPGTCQSHQKWEKELGFFFTPFFFFLKADSVFVFMRHSCVFHLMSCLMKEEKRERKCAVSPFSRSDRTVSSCVCSEVSHARDFPVFHCTDSNLENLLHTP